MRCSRLADSFLFEIDNIVPAHYFPDVLAKAEGYMGGAFEESPSVHVVRDVAPNKIMLCISFRVPERVAYRGREGWKAEGEGGGAGEVGSGEDASLSNTDSGVDRPALNGEGVDEQPHEDSKRQKTS
jgi:hypothetical protein